MPQAANKGERNTLILFPLFQSRHFEAHDLVREFIQTLPMQCCKAVIYKNTVPCVGGKVPAEGFHATR